MAGRAGSRTAGRQRPLLRATAVVAIESLLLVGGVAGVANRELLASDRFAAHVDAVRADPDVSQRLGELITERILRAQPDLVAVRPLIEAAAQTVLASPTIGPLVRAGAARAHRHLVLGDGGGLRLRLADVAAVVVALVTLAAPDVALSFPPDLDVRLSRLGGDSVPHVAQWVHLAQRLAWLCPLLALVVVGLDAILAVPLDAGAGRRARTAMVDLGRGVLGAALALVALVLMVGIRVGDGEGTLGDAVRRAAWRELDGGLWRAAAVGIALGSILVVAAAAGEGASPSRQRLVEALDPRGGIRHVAPGSLLLALSGAALVTQPTRVAVAVLWVSGVVLLVAAVVVLLVGVGHSLARTRPRLPATSARRAWAATALATLAAATALAARPGGGSAATSVEGGEACNGHVELCGRRYDQVAYPATHNSMAAASEPRWYLPEQPDGIRAQLDHGIRTLLVDSWYGRRTDRPGLVATAGRELDAAVAEARSRFGRAAVRSALRLREAVGLAPRGKTEPYLCHAMCELGATPWLSSLRELADWLAAHPREVVTLIVQDLVRPADTASLFEEAGLMRYVYTPVSGGEWPTLREMVESGRRLVVFMEGHGGGAAHPWLLQAFDWVQETPYLFRSAGQLSCAANRGDPDAGLFLVNHWITDRRRVVSNAEQVNARPVLLSRVEDCRRERGLLPNFVAVDFYDRGDLLGVVDTLNGVGQEHGPFTRFG